jgi:hypothetical protein
MSVRNRAVAQDGAEPHEDSQAEGGAGVSSRAAGTHIRGHDPEVRCQQHRAKNSGGGMTEGGVLTSKMAPMPTLVFREIRCD